MLKHIGKWNALSSPSIVPDILPNEGNNISKPYNHHHHHVTIVSSTQVFKLSRNQRALKISCNARRRAVRFDNEDENGEEDDDDGDENGYNEEIAMLELYSQSARGEALLVHALVDEQQVQVLIFKGFSSCLSYGTLPDPSRSVIPARAVIKSIDRIKGPFDPSNIQYIEKGIQWESFKTRLITN